MQLSKALSGYRTEFGRQAARNVVKLYEACGSVQSEDFRTFLDRGLDFAAMVAAFCAETPDRERESGGSSVDRLPDDYLVDVVKSCCGKRLFEGYAREQRVTLVGDLLPVRICGFVSRASVRTLLFMCQISRVLKIFQDACSADGAVRAHQPAQRAHHRRRA